MYESSCLQALNTHTHARIRYGLGLWKTFQLSIYGQAEGTVDMNFTGIKGTVLYSHHAVRSGFGASRQWHTQMSTSWVGCGQERSESVNILKSRFLQAHSMSSSSAVCLRVSFIIHSVALLSHVCCEELAFVLLLFSARYPLLRMPSFRLPRV